MTMILLWAIAGSKSIQTGIPAASSSVAPEYLRSLILSRIARTSTPPLPAARCSA